MYGDKNKKCQTKFHNLDLRQGEKSLLEGKSSGVVARGERGRGVARISHGHNVGVTRRNVKFVWYIVSSHVLYGGMLGGMFSWRA